MKFSKGIGAATVTAIGLLAFGGPELSHLRHDFQEAKRDHKRILCSTMIDPSSGAEKTVDTFIGPKGEEFVATTHKRSDKGSDLLFVAETNMGTDPTPDDRMARVEGVMIKHAFPMSLFRGYSVKVTMMPKGPGVAAAVRRWGNTLNSCTK